MSWLEQSTALYSLATNIMDKTVQAFHSETEQVHKDEQGQLKVQVATTWPNSAG